MTYQFIDNLINKRDFDSWEAALEVVKAINDARLPPDKKQKFYSD